MLYEISVRSLFWAGDVHPNLTGDAERKLEARETHRRQMVGKDHTKEKICGRTVARIIAFAQNNTFLVKRTEQGTIF